MRNFLFLCALCVLAVGCKSGDSDTTATTSPTTAPTGTTGSPPPGGVGGPGETGGPAAGGVALDKSLKGYAAVQDLFTKRCVGCHGAGRAKAGIHLTDYASVMKGGKEGVIVVAGKPDDSLLIKVLKSAPGAKPMPPKGPLPADEEKIVEDWVKDGAKA